MALQGEYNPERNIDSGGIFHDISSQCFLCGKEFLYRNMVKKMLFLMRHVGLVNRWETFVFLLTLFNLPISVSPATGLFYTFFLNNYFLASIVLRMYLLQYTLNVVCNC